MHGERTGRWSGRRIARASNGAHDHRGEEDGGAHGSETHDGTRHRQGRTKWTAGVGAAHTLTSAAMTYGLRPNILSQWETLAQSLSSIAPTAAPAMIIPLVIAAAGRSAWVSFVVATVAMALVAAHVNVFARDSATPGSLYAFVRGDLGTWVALPAGWALLVAYIG